MACNPGGGDRRSGDPMSIPLGVLECRFTPPSQGCPRPMAIAARWRAVAAPTTHGGPLMKLLRNLAIAAVACGIGLAIAGCNTTRGVGQDVQAAGRGVENAAN